MPRIFLDSFKRKRNRTNSRSWLTWRPAEKRTGSSVPWRSRATLLALVAALAFGLAGAVDLAGQAGERTAMPLSAEDHTSPFSASDAALPSEQPVQQYANARLQSDVAAMRIFRPAYRFWRTIYAFPDGFVLFGSATDGRLLGTVPIHGNWVRDAVWEDTSLAAVFSGRQLPANLVGRREEIARLLEPSVGPVLHNASRGLSLLPNARRYGSFLSEWGLIYERFAVPADIGLAQAIVESGLNGTVRSEAQAVGFCQWLLTNWNRLKQLAPIVIEGHNQTTQAPYCAAYLTILSTKYGTFIPALSEHHTGGINVGRTLINGERLGAADVRERYFLGAEFARDLRDLAPGVFKDIYGTYGPRSFRYAEMVFGNMATVAHLRETIPQSQVFAMRTTHALPLAEITRRTGLSVETIRRFNPALLNRVPARGTLYLPMHVPALGSDVSFWHRRPTATYVAALNDFVRLDVSMERWDSESFDAVLSDFRRRFDSTKAEEGTIMATTLAYVLAERHRSRQAQILAEFRANERFQRLFEQGRLERDAAARASNVAAPVPLIVGPQ